MPNHAFKIMPMIKFSMHCVMAEEVQATKKKKKQKHSSKCAKNSDQTECADPGHDELRHMCEQCGYRTRILGNLKVHRRRHTGEKPFHCNICNASFVAQYQLTTHKERHMDTDQRRGRYICRECNIGFLSARSLYHHRPLHALVKQFKCGICEKAYSQAAGYAQHKRWHRQRNERATTTTNQFKSTQNNQNEFKLSREHA